MRVLHNFHTYLKTTENWAFNLISNLPDTDIVIAAKSFEKCNFYDPRFTYLEFPLHQIETGSPNYLVRRYNKFVRSMLRQYYPWYIGKMAGKIDIMHSHFSFVGWQYRSVARKLAVPHIISFYGFDYEWLPHNDHKWRKRYSTLFSEADLFLCEGEHGARILEESGCPASKIKVARLGVTTDRIPFFHRKKDAGELKLLQVASLSAKKGHLYTIRAFLAALTACPNMSLTIVGRDSEGVKSDLLKMIDKNLLGTKIHFIDQIDFAKLHDFMNDYHLFIHPSCYSDDRDCEGGAPVVLLDAQATGMPVIATTHCDIPSVVKHGETGLLAPEKDVPALASHIAHFYGMSQEGYDTFALNARRHVTSNYDVVSNAHDLHAIYKQLIA